MISLALKAMLTLSQISRFQPFIEACRQEVGARTKPSREPVATPEEMQRQQPGSVLGPQRAESPRVTDVRNQWMSSLKWPLSNIRLLPSFSFITAAAFWKELLCEPPAQRIQRNLISVWITASRHHTGSFKKPGYLLSHLWRPPFCNSAIRNLAITHQPLLPEA